MSITDIQIFLKKNFSRKRNKIEILKNIYSLLYIGIYYLFNSYKSVCYVKK